MTRRPAPAILGRLDRIDAGMNRLRESVTLIHVELACLIQERDPELAALIMENLQCLDTTPGPSSARRPFAVVDSAAEAPKAGRSSPISR